MDEPLSTADILEQAADLIETVGHARNTSIKRDPKTRLVTGYCITGAIRQIAGQWKVLEFGPTMDAIKAVSMELSYRAYRPLSGEYRPLSGEYRSPANDVAFWNDRIAEDGAEVIDVLRHAAKNLRNKGEPE